jgi:hypothetical protein
LNFIVGKLADLIKAEIGSSSQIKHQPLLQDEPKQRHLNLTPGKKHPDWDASQVETISYVCERGWGALRLE